MHYRYREVLARLYPDDKILGSGICNDEAYVVTQDRLIIYGSDGWVSEFQLDEISYDIVEIQEHQFFEIIDLLDPTAENFFYYGLYEARNELIELLQSAGVKSITLPLNQHPTKQYPHLDMQHDKESSTKVPPPL